MMNAPLSPWGRATTPVATASLLSGSSESHAAVIPAASEPKVSPTIETIRDLILHRIPGKRLDDAVMNPEGAADKRWYRTRLDSEIGKEFARLFAETDARGRRKFTLHQIRNRIRGNGN